MCRHELFSQAGSGPNVASIAYRWGFVNAAYFSRSFRAAFGMSPREWLVACRAG
ncbi:helix-turn-helix domain-containing protein [Kitasatospora sp. NPDC054939]